MKSTYSARPSEVTRKWYIIDATEAPMGRIATKVATLLTGKEKPMFTAHIDCGDHVVVINAKDIVLTGDKSKKMYYRHSQYPGALKEATLTEKMDKDPTYVLFHAIRGMLPVNKLRDGRLNRLKIYADGAHKHEAQQPEKISLKKTENTKGSK